MNNPNPQARPIPAPNHPATRPRPADPASVQAEALTSDRVQAVALVYHGGLMDS